MYYMFGTIVFAIQNMVSILSMDIEYVFLKICNSFRLFYFKSERWKKKKKNVIEKEIEKKSAFLALFSLYIICVLLT